MVGFLKAIYTQAGKCCLLFSDAVHFTLSSFVCNVWSRKRVYLKTAAGRNWLNVLGTVDAVTKEVFTEENTTYITAEMDKAKNLGIELLFLPPYSLNLNIIERLWKFTKKSVLYERYYDKPAKFHQTIKDFLRGINLRHQSELNSLLTLKFQIINSENAHFDPA